MVQINFGRKEINCKIVYYGPGLSGKTTNLEKVHEIAPNDSKGDLTSISTDGDRTLFFDFMPLDLGTVAGMRTKFHIYTVPGQVYYNSTRKLVLLGADGVIFVADSAVGAEEANRQSLDNLKENLLEMGKDIAKMPLVIQYNKRDLPDAKPVDVLEKELNTYEVPSFEAVASKGDGVIQTLKAISSLVLESINSNERAGTLTSGSGPAPGMMPPTQPGPEQQDAPVADTASAPAAATSQGEPVSAGAAAASSTTDAGSAPTTAPGIERNYIPTEPQADTAGSPSPVMEPAPAAAAAGQDGVTASDGPMNQPGIQGNAPVIPSQSQELEQMGTGFQSSAATATATLPNTQEQAQQPAQGVAPTPAPVQQTAPPPPQPAPAAKPAQPASVPSQKAAVQQDKMNAVLREKMVSDNNQAAKAITPAGSRGIQVIGGKPKSKQKSGNTGLIVAIIVVVLLLAGAGAAYFLLM